MIPVAIQLFTLREACETDMATTLKKVKEIGYQGVELAGYGDLTVEEVKKTLDQLDLFVAGNHVPLHDLTNRLNEVIKEQKILGNTRVVCPYILPENRNYDFYQDLPSILQSIQRELAQHGMVLVYHHHDFELEEYRDNESVLSYLLKNVNGLKLELDVYWIQKAKEKPVDWISRYKDQLVLLHLKDMSSDERETFAPLGTGRTDLKSILTTAQPDVWIVEQDQTDGDPFEAIKTSYQYLKNEGVVDHE
ncbi:Sugar phosphate isomerase/epimerase [Pelagirhabdus alkalitolerans]|uniref:Sugar phosphate isomerase/epimerase n=1 Tax=Pelagirhabdus alkalitolerans TaxID=1612202 RepID=A0A1G6GLB2_9BACI|nr:sugar phosphate isomerase/epimerase [Pelagirhabdus alkalitolerans]SDB82750.1 Sugar phosphate isomerase/epimerase [Pelagirhabdus alkalitolerans]